MFFQTQRKPSTIDSMSLTLSTCNVLVIYKVLALTCAWSKSERKLPNGVKISSSSQISLKQYMIHLLLVIYKVLALACAWGKSNKV